MTGTPNEVQAEIADNDAALDEAVDQLRNKRVDEGRAFRAIVGQDDEARDAANLVAAEVKVLTKLVGTLNVAKRQLKLDLHAAQCAEKKAKKAAILEFATDRLAEADAELRECAIEVCALSDMLGHPRDHVGLQHIQYHTRMAELTKEMLK